MKRGVIVAVVLMLALLPGCSPKAPVTPPAQASAPSPALEEAPQPAPPLATQETAPAPAPTPAPSSAPGPSPLPPTPPPPPPGPYTGPLFDTHLHLYNMYQGTPDQLSRLKLKSAADLLSYLGRNKVEGAIGFYAFPANKAGRNWVSTAETIISGSRSRVVPLLQPSPSSDFASGQFTEAVLRQYLQPKGLLQGVGELVLIKPELQSVTFDGPVMQNVFKVVNESKGVVMIHLSNTREGMRPTELAEIEPAIQKYPDTVFLFHSGGNFPLHASLMAKYPNVYYTTDAPSLLFAGGQGPSLYPADASSSNAASFLAAVNRIGVDSIVKESLKSLALRFQQFPDRIMWGTDFGGDATLSWHFEDSVTDMVIRISREFIGALPPDIQGKYAYRNALSVFGRFLTPE